MSTYKTCGFVSQLEINFAERVICIDPIWMNMTKIIHFVKIGCCDNVYRAVGVLAELLNKSADAETFHNRSKNYKNVWNKERELMCPRSKSGEFHCPIDPTLNTWIVKDDGFTEGEHGGLL